MKVENGKWKVENGKSKQWQNERFAVEVARRSETAYEKTPFVLPRERQMYIVTSTNGV